MPVIGKYRHLTKNQVDYVVGISKERENYLSVFFHMPSQMFETAYHEGVKSPSYRQSAPYRYDQIKAAKRFDEGIAESSNIALISCSHIHSNSMLSLYNGRYYELSSASGFGAERNADVMPVATEITVNLTATSVEDLYAFARH